MKVTVATVCYNSKDTIEKTIISVLEQTYDEIEYIIVDGASSDGTLDIICRYACDERIKVISEPDNGLYDAMNKAADASTGEYIIYMNSGDLFADKSAISKIAYALDGQNDLVYGNVIRIKNKGRFLEKYGGNGYMPMLLILQGKMMCHQSMFTRCQTMREYRFDTDYSITADYDFLVRLLHDKRKLFYADVTVSVVDSITGISSSVRNMDEMRRQDDRSLKKHYPTLYYMVFCPKALVRAVRRILEKTESKHE